MNVKRNEDDPDGKEVIRMSEKEQEKKEEKTQEKCGCGCVFSTEKGAKTAKSADKESK